MQRDKASRDTLASVQGMTSPRAIRLARVHAEPDVHAGATSVSVSLVKGPLLCDLLTYLMNVEVACCARNEVIQGQKAEVRDDDCVAAPPSVHKPPAPIIDSDTIPAQKTLFYALLPLQEDEAPIDTVDPHQALTRSRVLSWEG
jgi:hypothetical protein